MVFVSVGNEDRFDTINIVNDIRVIRDHIVDPKEVVFWKFDPGIDNDDFILVLDPVGIFPDFSKSTNGKYTNFFRF